MIPGWMLVLPGALAGCIFSIDESRLDSESGKDDAGASEAGIVEAGASEGGQSPEGLVGHWSFEETAGTVAVDTSGRGNDGILTSVVRDDGVSGRAVSTDVNTRLGEGWLEVPAFHGSSFPKRGTLSMWIRARRVLDRVEEPGGNAFLDQAPNSGKRGSWLSLAYGRGDGPTDFVHAGFPYPRPNEPNDLTVDQLRIPAVRDVWNHVVIVWGPGAGPGPEARLYCGTQGTPLAVTVEPYERLRPHRSGVRAHEAAIWRAGRGAPLRSCAVRRRSTRAALNRDEHFRSQRSDHSPAQRGADRIAQRARRAGGGDQRPGPRARRSGRQADVRRWHGRSRRYASLTDETVAREHVRLSLLPNGIRIRDPGSTNGTWLGLLRVSEIGVPHSTELSLADTKLAITIEAEPVDSH